MGLIIVKAKFALQGHPEGLYYSGDAGDNSGINPSLIGAFAPELSAKE